VDLARRHWPLLLVAAALVASTFVVPTLAPVAVSDDFVYARSVATLVHDGELRILPAAATAVFPVLWGGLFGAVFGVSFGVLRVSTFVIWLLGGLAAYGLCRELGVDRARSTLGAALVWWHPLGYVLAFTFMTDGFFTSLLAMAAYGYVRGFAREGAGRWVVAGSAAAGLAFLVRQHGLLIPLAVLTWLAVARRLTVREAVRVSLVPVLTALAYTAATVTGLVDQASNSGDFLAAAGDAGVRGTLSLVRQVAFVELEWVGFFALPLVVGAAVALPRVVRRMPRLGWALVAGWVVVLAYGFVGFRTRHLGFPYVPQFVDRAGLGPSGDLRGGRAPLLSYSTTAAVGWVVAALSVAAAVLLARALVRAPAWRGPAGLVAVLAAWQAAGVVPSSFPVRATVVSYDRYLLPLLPLLVALVLWAVRDLRLRLAPAWVATAALAAVSVAGTHDYLAFQSATWRAGRDAFATGVGPLELDAGAAWDGYHVFRRPVAPEDVPVPADPGRAEVEPGAPPPPPPPLILSEHDVPAWWVGFYTPGVVATHVVASEPLLGFEVVARYPFSSWLEDEPTAVYLLRRGDVAG
jgi:hypothetical protein